jgi:hypothetical protein
MAACGAFEVAQQAAITGLQVSMVVFANHTTEETGYGQDPDYP